jgi:hypothetical protein
MLASDKPLAYYSKGDISQHSFKHRAEGHSMFFATMYTESML